MKECVVEGCAKPSRRNRMCVMHVSRWERYGDLSRGRMTKRPAEERFWPKVDKTDACWIWVGSIGTGGYGTFWTGTASHNAGPGSHIGAHRFAYELLVGSVPEEKDLDHLCRNRACVNPAHLEPVTRKVNLRRGVRAGGQYPWR